MTREEFGTPHPIFVGATLTIFLNCAMCVSILDIRVPRVIESGLEDYVDLECEYEYLEEEKDQLDIKWYFNNEDDPFVQWVPTSNRLPQVIGERFKGRLVLDHKVHKDRYKKHRGLRIRKPTVELSGTYQCKASSFLNEDVKKKKMTVYSPAKRLDLVYSTLHPGEEVNVSCTATGVFPEPEISLSWGQIPTNEAVTTTTISRGQQYDVTVHKLLRVDQLQSDTVFTCDLNIPGTTYSLREQTMYFPGKTLPRLAASSQGIKCNYVLIELTTLIAIIVYSVQCCVTKSL